MTTAPVIDARPHVAAIKAAVKAEFGRWDAYDYGEVPGSDGNAGTLPYIYALVSVDRRFVPVQRATARAGRSSWRVTVRSVGRTADECRWAAAKVSTALDEASLTLGGYTSTRLLHESSSDAEPDDGRFSALASFTYTF